MLCKTNLQTKYRIHPVTLSETGSHINIFGVLLVLACWRVQVLGVPASLCLYMAGVFGVFLCLCSISLNNDFIKCQLKRDWQWRLQFPRPVEIKVLENTLVLEQCLWTLKQFSIKNSKLCVWIETGLSPSNKH